MVLESLVEQQISHTIQCTCTCTLAVKFNHYETHIRVLGPLQTTTQVLSIGSTLCSNPKYAATLHTDNKSAEITW